ncbi:hypothetical protein CCACVL1_18393 [Corchorus capsularis]|uniref:Uncharacterized protein n=1 Tax=Corchorus capsularis TaxID=210143 RepID=A0A1R3HLJ6_COCAP|nr:hypothetical protein CCACVL1_18393 [Corchorus capsularis]
MPTFMVLINLVVCWRAFLLFKELKRSDLALDLGFPALGVNQLRLRRLSIAAVVGDKTALPNDYDTQSPASNEVNRDTENEDEKGSVEGLDDCKMIRVCDKLIEVFMVDKPTPTDWRRLLAFSKEWNNLRPHFFQRCHDRADAEADPGMKHKLLRLGRKLKEIDEDVPIIYGKYSFAKE